MLSVKKTETGTTISNELYGLAWSASTPQFVRLTSAKEGTWADLFVASGVHTVDKTDVTSGLGKPEVRKDGGSLIMEFVAESTLWSEKKCIFRCTDQALEYHVEISGKGSLGSCGFFHGFTSAPVARDAPPAVDYISKEPPEVKGAHPQASTPAFAIVFNPQPNHETRQRIWFGEYSAIFACADTAFVGRDFHGGTWQLTPPPLCYAVAHENARQWMTFGIGTHPGQYTFHCYEYFGGSVFGLSLAYDGHTRVDGRWESPRIIMAFADGEYQAEQRYVDLLVENGLIAFQKRKTADWWFRPIVCGWGQECYYRCLTGSVPPPHYCTQALYEHIDRTLEKRGLDYGSLVIDDKWQTFYGTPNPDTGKWPDMKGFIEAQHAKGHRVLLWLKLWDCEGLPADECVTDENGKPVTADPSNPAYEKRLRAAVRHLLSSDKGGLDADGFKLDSISQMPVGNKKKAHGTLWGIELLKKLYTIIYEEAKRTKPDALIIAHSPNPYFAEVIDVLRLNDIHHADERIVERMTHRAKIARIACPAWGIDTDNWPMPNRKTWLTYMREQPKLGIPSLYYADHIDISGEAIQDEDYAEIRRIWTEYEKSRAKQ